MIETSSSLHRKSSAIFVNFRNFSEVIRKRSSRVRNIFGKFSKIIGKWSEIFGKSSVCLVARTSERVRNCSFHSTKKFISSRHRITSSLYGSSYWYADAPIYNRTLWTNVCSSELVNVSLCGKFHPEPHRSTHLQFNRLSKGVRLNHTDQVG